MNCNSRPIQNILRLDGLVLNKFTSFIKDYAPAIPHLKELIIRNCSWSVDNETMKTAILGGGLTDLTLGYLLHDKGVNFEILEKEIECGGLLRSLQEEGFTFDYGGVAHNFLEEQRRFWFHAQTIRWE